MSKRQLVGAVMVLCSVLVLSYLYLIKPALMAAPPAAETPHVSSVVTSAPPATVAPSRTVKPRALPPSEVERLKIPGVLNATAGGAIRPNDANQLVPPTSNDVFRWAERGMPGCTSRDTVFLLGHTVRAGGGVFDKLQTVQVGQQVIVITKTGTIRYEVTRTQLFDKETITKERDVYATVPGRLVLVGCFLNPDGSIQTRNFVVMAQRVSC